MRGRSSKRRVLVVIHRLTTSTVTSLLSRTPSISFLPLLPFVQHLSAVQAENMTSRLFEDQEERKRAKRKTLRKQSVVQGADM